MKTQGWNFDHFMYSCELGIVKPDREIYEHALATLNLKPEEVVFIDDLEKNVQGAQAVGIRAILFESLDQLKSELTNLKVNI